MPKAKAPAPEKAPTEKAPTKKSKPTTKPAGFPLNAPNVFGSTVTPELDDVDNVTAIQNALSVSETGTYDQVTRHAVKSFQAVQELPISGCVDEVTWARLGL